MKFSPLASRLRPSPISEVFDKAVKLRAEGRDLADFSVGEPDFDTPKHIAEAGRQAILDGHTRYTGVDGSPAMKDAAIGKFKRENGLNFDRSQIVVGSGAKAAIEQNYKMSAEDLKKAISPQTRLLILSSPSNPTGSVYNRAELEAFAAVLRAYPDIAVISDDLYEHILYDDVEFVTLACVAPDLQDRVLTVNGVSKAYAMTGWRIGYAGGPSQWARKIAGYFSQTEGSPCAISQRAAIAALEGPQDFLKDWQKIYQARRDLFLSILAQTDFVQANHPEGAFYIFVDIQKALGRKTPSGDLLRDDRDFANYLLDCGVVVTPASAFESEAGMRISIATSETEIEKGATRILEAVKALQP